MLTTTWMPSIFRFSCVKMIPRPTVWVSLLKSLLRLNGATDAYNFESMNNYRLSPLGAAAHSVRRNCLIWIQLYLKFRSVRRFHMTLNNLLWDKLFQYLTDFNNQTKATGKATDANPCPQNEVVRKEAVDSKVRNNCPIIQNNFAVLVS